MDTTISIVNRLGWAKDFVVLRSLSDERCIVEEGGLPVLVVLSEDGVWRFSEVAATPEEEPHFQALRTPANDKTIATPAALATSDASKKTKVSSKKTKKKGTP